MCMIDSANERVTMLAKTARRAQKNHKCDECYRMIEPVERYLEERFVDDGMIFTHKTCRHCQVVRDWLLAECSGWVFGSVKEDLHEHAVDGDYPTDVKRLAVSMRRKWRDFHGRLMLAPERPPTTRERQTL